MSDTIEPLDPYDGPEDDENDDLDWVTEFRRDHGLRVDEDTTPTQ